MEYRKAVEAFVGRFWQSDVRQKFAKDSSLPESRLSARALQAAAKQALAIVNGTLSKTRRRTFVIKKLTDEGDLAAATRLHQIQEARPVSKPIVGAVSAELDSRFVKIRQDTKTKRFDIWLTIGSLGTAKSFSVPLCKHRLINKWLRKGKLRPSIRLSEDKVTFFFEVEEPEPNGTKVLGVDMGSRKTFATSDGDVTPADCHGWTMAAIQKRLASRKKGSNGFRRTQNHRENFIRWSVNQLNLSSVGELRIEALKNVRLKKRVSRFLQSWVYADIVGAVERKCEERGVRVTRVAPQYTSQRCSTCGHVEKSNRKSEAFLCKRCGFSGDADINAARNIALGGIYSFSAPESV